MLKINTFITYESQAEEAAALYVSIFPNSRILEVTHYGEAGPGTPGSVMTVRFLLNGQEYVALNGGSHFTFTDGVSLSVECATQAQVDEYSAKLSAGGEQGPCGWVKDRFGFSWQVGPSILNEMLADPDPKKAGRAMAAMLKMKKIDIAELMRAFDGR